MKLVSVVITNFNRLEDLRDGLRSIEEQDYPAVETIVVDNASSDGSQGMVRKEFSHAKIIALAKNIGMQGYSVGFEHARGEFIFQMDNDSMMPDRDVLSEVVRRFEEGPKELGVVATRVEECRTGENDVEGLRSKDKRRGPINTGGFHSGGVGFKKKLLDEVGYYDPDVFLYGSELFLQMKFLHAGYLVFYYPEILMLHKSSGVARSSNGVYYELRNRYWFMRRFASRDQQLRFIPNMILHDAIYCVYKKRPLAFVRSLKDGFGPLPPSLKYPLRSNNPDFVKKVDEVGSSFYFSKLHDRVLNHLG